MAEDLGIKFIILGFIAVIVGLALFSSNFQSDIGKMTTTYTATNTSFTMPAAAATAELTPCGQKIVSGLVIVNSSNATQIVTSSNYTTSQSAGRDGYLAAQITTDSNAKFAGLGVNVSCVYEQKGYVSDSGTRAIVPIIAIMMALLIVVAAIPPLRDKFFDFIKGV